MGTEQTLAARMRAEATEAAWARIDQEYGLLTTEEVRRRLDPAHAEDTDLLVGVHRDGATRYPGFQVDGARVRPVMGRLRRAADQYNVRDAALVLWMTSPTTWWGDDARPVDHFEDPDGIVEAFRSHFGVQW